MSDSPLIGEEYLLKKKEEVKPEVEVVPLIATVPEEKLPTYGELLEVWKKRMHTLKEAWDVASPKVREVIGGIIEGYAKLIQKFEKLRKEEEEKKLKSLVEQKEQKSHEILKKEYGIEVY